MRNDSMYRYHYGMIRRLGDSTAALHRTLYKIIYDIRMQMYELLYEIRKDEHVMHEIIYRIRTRVYKMMYEIRKDEQQKHEKLVRPNLYAKYF